MGVTMPAQVSAESPPAAGIPPSCLHDVFRAAEAWERETRRPVNRLHVGEPAFRMPPVEAEALTKADLRRLLALAEERGWYVISDEAYEHFIFDGQHLSMAALEADLPPAQRRVFTTYSFSKSYAMTGCRLGYVVAPNEATASAL